MNSFIHNGPNGKHFVMVFEILGVNFLEIIKRYNYKGGIFNNVITIYSSFTFGEEIGQIMFDRLGLHAQDVSHNTY